MVADHWLSFIITRVQGKRGLLSSKFSCEKNHIAKKTGHVTENRCDALWEFDVGDKPDVPRYWRSFQSFTHLWTSWIEVKDTFTNECFNHVFAPSFYIRAHP